MQYLILTIFVRVFCGFYQYFDFPVSSSSTCQCLHHFLIIKYFHKHPSFVRQEEKKYSQILECLINEQELQEQ